MDSKHPQPADEAIQAVGPPETQETKPANGEPIEIPVPKVSTIRAAIRKLAQPDKSPGK